MMFFVRVILAGILLWLGFLIAPSGKGVWPIAVLAFILVLVGLRLLWLAFVDVVRSTGPPLHVSRMGLEPEPPPVSVEWASYVRCVQRGRHDERFGACGECGFERADFSLSAPHLPL